MEHRFCIYLVALSAGYLKFVEARENVDLMLSILVASA